MESSKNTLERIVATTPFTIPVQVLINSTKGSERSEKKKEVKFDLFSEFAPLTAQSCSQGIESFLFIFWLHNPDQCGSGNSPIQKCSQYKYNYCKDQWISKKRNIWQEID